LFEPCGTIAESTLPVWRARREPAVLVIVAVIGQTITKYNDVVIADHVLEKYKENYKADHPGKLFTILEVDRTFYTMRPLLIPRRNSMKTS
jgi:hypothetical protein